MQLQLWEKTCILVCIEPHGAGVLVACGASVVLPGAEDPESAIKHSRDRPEPGPESCFKDKC